MKRGNLSIKDKLRNKRIARKRAPGERTQVKTRERVEIKEMFKYFAYDLYQLVTLERKRLSVS